MDRTTELLDSLRHLASAAESERALTDAARTYPDTLRQALARTFSRIAVLDHDSDSADWIIARRLAAAYAAAWQDSFLIRDVARFTSWSPDERRGRVLADSLRQAGIDAMGREGVPAALIAWRSALSALAPVDSAGQAAVLAAIGAGLYLTGDTDSATWYLESARAIAARLDDRRALGTATGVLASIRKDAGDLAGAAELYDEAAALRQRSGDRRGMAADYNNLGLIARELGDLDQARRAFWQALELNRRDGRYRQVALNLTNLGDLGSIQGEYQLADSLYGEALAINRADGDVAEAAFVLHDMGLLATRRGDYTRARDLLLGALESHQQSGAIAEAAAVRHDLAAVQVAIGDLQGALGSLARAEQEARALSDAPELMADLALRRADAAVQFGAFSEAEAAFAVAESTYRSIGDEAGRANAHQGRAHLLSLRGDQEGARRALELASRAYRGTGDRRGEGVTQLLLGQVQIEQGDTVAARRTLTRARAALRALGDAVTEAAVLDALGQLASRTGATLAAEQLFHEGLGILGNAPAVDVRWQLRAHLAEALRSRGALGAAARALDSAIAAIEAVAEGLRLEERRVGYLTDKWTLYATLSRVEQERGRTVEAFAASERLRARQLRDLLARGRVATRRERSGREQDLRRRITELLRAVEIEDASGPTQRETHVTGASPGATVEALARAQRDYASLLRDLRESDPAYRQLITADIVSWTAVASRLAPDEAFLQYLVTDAGSTVFVITRDTIASVQLDVDRTALHTTVEFARRTMERPGRSPATPLWRAPLRRLFRQLIEPLEERRLLEGKARLVIVPHGELHFVHFGALLDERSNDRFLIERFELTYAPSATVWVQLRDRSAAADDGSVLALAPRTTRLPASREEVLAIRRTHRGRTTVLTGKAATKRALLNDARNHRIIHIASYGILNKHNPLFSFVELAPSASDDGRLEVHEVYGMELTGQLVVLSACQTALGSGSIADVPTGDDWVGLVQAFLYAGAGGVLASLWPVEDRATAELMHHFYRSLGAGRSQAAALAEAQRALLRGRESVHPFHWAGFVLVGGGRN